MRQRHIIALLLILPIAISARSILYAAEVVDRIVAVVNDEVITQSELEESMLPFVADYKVRYGEEELDGKIDEARQDALNRLIEEKLLLQEAKKRDIKVEDSEIEERINEVKSRFPSEEEFNMTIQQSGITLAKLKNKYKEQIMMRKLVAGTISQGVNISPTEIAAYYYGNIKDFQTPKMVRFKVLLIKPSADRNIQLTEVLALQVLDRIRAGEDFDILVKEYSQGPNIDTGGDMGYMPEDGIIKELKDAMSQLQAGEASGLVKTVSGFNIVKVIDRKEPGAKPLAEVTDVIRERLFQRESELTLREFINKLKEDAYIKIQ